MPMRFILNEDKLMYNMDDASTQANKGLKIFRNPLVVSI